MHGRIKGDKMSKWKEVRTETSQNGKMIERKETKFN